MASVKRTKAQIISDRLEIARRYLEGQFQIEIAQALGTTQEMVCYDLKAVQRQWQENYAHRLDELKAKELAKIDNLEKNYWEAWQQSLKPTQITSSGKKGSTVSVNKRTEQRNGNPAFLQGVQWCVDRRIKLLGLDAPVKAELSGSMNINQDFSPAEMTTDELLAIASMSSIQQNDRDKN